jgi:hypothetical protein
MDKARSVLAFSALMIFLGAVSAQESALFPVSIGTDFINPDVPPDATETYYILITPTNGHVSNLRLSTFGRISEFITLEEDSINLDYGETREIEILLDTKDADVGTYTGSIILGHNGNTKEIPLKINVVKKVARIDVKLTVKTKEVEEPKPIKFLLEIYNVGQRDSFNLHIIYKLNSDTGRTLATVEEDATLITSLNLERTFFSEDYPLSEGVYYIETTVSYEDKETTYIDTFNFIEPFWTTTKISFLIVVIVVAAFAVGFLFTINEK